MKANEYLHSKKDTQQQSGFAGVQSPTVRVTIVLFSKRVNNNFCHLYTRKSNRDWATDNADLDQIFHPCNLWLTVLPDRAEAGVPEAFVEGRDVLGQQFIAARFQ